MDNKYQTVLKFIERVRDSFDGSIDVYTKGSCVKFGLILTYVFGGEILYNGNHAITEINGFCFDITGEVLKTDDYIPLTEYGMSRAYDLMNNKFKING